MATGIDGRRGGRASPAGGTAAAATATTTKARGDDAEARALAHLLRQGLALVERNWRLAAGAGRRGGEIDLVMRDRDGTLVFVEVRQRRDASYGGAAASVGAAKRLRLVHAARHYLSRHAAAASLPCRFDVVAIDGGADGRVEWLRAAFDADGR